MPKPADRAGQARRARNRSTHVETHLKKPGKNISKHRILSSEKMGAAGNIEEQPVLSVQGNKRCVTITPVGNRFQKGKIGSFILVEDIDVWIHGPRFGKPLPSLKAACLRHFIDCNQSQCIVAPAGTDDRRMVRTPFRTPRQPPELSGDPVGRQIPKVKRQNALATCGKKICLDLGRGEIGGHEGSTPDES
ncbi:hypothetical protein D3C80_461240 [compost metagenome]